MAFNVGLFFAMIFIVISLAAFFHFGLRRGWFAWHTCREVRVAGSHLLPLPALLGIRGAIALYALGIWIDIWVSGHAQGLVYYTVWSFTLLTLYFITCTVLTFLALRGGGPTLAVTRSSIFASVLFQVVICTCLLVDVVLWGVLLPYQRHSDPDNCCSQFFNFSSYNVHGVNLLLIFIDFVINRHEIILAHGAFAVIYPLIYATFSWIYHAAGGRWVYFFLDTSRKSAGAWYLGLCALHITFFLCVWAVGLVKKHLVRKYRGANLAEEESIQGESARLLSRQTIVA